MEQSKLKEGDVVKIYEDPITRKKLEGEAKLIDLQSRETDIHLDYYLEDWNISFPNKDGVYLRKIRIDR